MTPHECTKTPSLSAQDAKNNNKKEIMDTSTTALTDLYGSMVNLFVEEYTKKFGNSVVLEAFEKEIKGKLPAFLSENGFDINTHKVDPCLIAEFRQVLRSVQTDLMDQLNPLFFNTLMRDPQFINEAQSLCNQLFASQPSLQPEKMPTPLSIRSTLRINKAKLKLAENRRRQQQQPSLQTWDDTNSSRFRRRLWWTASRIPHELARADLEHKGAKGARKWRTAVSDGISDNSYNVSEEELASSPGLHN